MFRIEKHVATIREVKSEMKDRAKYMYDLGYRYFETEAEAVRAKREDLEKDIANLKSQVVSAERRLKNFDKKWGKL